MTDPAEMVREAIREAMAYAPPDRFTKGEAALDSLVAERDMWAQSYQHVAGEKDALMAERDLLQAALEGARHLDQERVAERDEARDKEAIAMKMLDDKTYERVAAALGKKVVAERDRYRDEIDQLVAYLGETADAIENHNAKRSEIAALLRKTQARFLSEEKAE